MRILVSIICLPIVEIHLTLSCKGKGACVFFTPMVNELPTYALFLGIFKFSQIII